MLKTGKNKSIAIVYNYYRYVVSSFIQDNHISATEGERLVDVAIEKHGNRGVNHIHLS